MGKNTILKVEEPSGGGRPPWPTTEDDPLPEGYTPGILEEGRCGTAL